MNQLKLSVMMFLQFFTWGAWFVTLAVVLSAQGMGSIIGDSYGTAPIAAIISPLFLGLIADRFFPSEKVLSFLMFVGGALMLFVPSVIADGNSSLVYWLFFAHMLCFMPTLGLGNTIVFTHLESNQFPKVRVWGTIGWIAAGLLAGFLQWSDSVNLFKLAGGSAVLLGAFSLFLPSTPPPCAGKPIDLKGLFMVDAFKMLAKPGFLVFIICSTLICIPLAYYFLSTAPFLANMGFNQPASAMAVGQMSEIIFMLLIPFFFRKLGVKWMIVIGMLAWVARYLLFAFGASEQTTWMLFLGIAIHGICYDFFFVTGFMYADRIAPKEIKGQIQSMLVFFTQGVGMYFGYKVAGVKFAPVSEQSSLLNENIKSNTTTDSLSFLEQWGQMFSVKLPEATNNELLASAAEAWQAYWIYPAILAGGIAIVFFLGFWDKSADGE